MENCENEKDLKIKEQNKSKFTTFLIGVLLGSLIVFIINFGIKLYFTNTYGVNIVDSKFLAIANTIDKNYVNEYDKKDFIEGAYKGMVAGLDDKYSEYMPKEEFEKYMDNTNGNYNGLGLYLAFDDEKKVAIVVGVFPNSPISDTNIKTGDIIVSLNGVEIVDMVSYKKSVESIKEKNDLIKVVYKNENSEKLNTVEVKKQQVDIPSVSGKILKDNIGYIIIASFDGVTYEQFENELKKLQDNNMQRLIIDLRDNPGGLMRTVVPITNKFIPKGFVTYTEDKYGKRVYQYSDEDMLGIPLVVLINGGSASASEVMSGAIKDTGVGKLVGTKTYGKGVVQNIFSFPDGSGLKLTTSKYYTPSGKCIDGIGIEPDYKVEYELAENEKYSLENDLQLQKAIEVVKEIN